LAALTLALGLIALVALGRSDGDSTAAAGSQAGRAGPRELLPDLDQAAPSKLVLTTSTRAARPVFRLGFASAVTNVGAGPLIVDGRRFRPAGAMRADQVLVRADGSTRTVRGVGALRYVRSADHSHWHLLPFERYEIRLPGASDSAVRDAKTGFCLGDRYDSKRNLEGKPTKKVFRGRCGLRAPHLRRLREGISVGYGDDYDPTLEGQYVELTGLAAGRYVLVHRVNGDRRLLESDYSNNEASRLLRIAWRGGTPRVETLKICPASGECDVKPRSRKTS